MERTVITSETGCLIRLKSTLPISEDIDGGEIAFGLTAKNEW